MVIKKGNGCNQIIRRCTIKNFSCKQIVEAGIAVTGHVGLTPHAVSVFGGFRPQGKNVLSAVKSVHEPEKSPCLTSCNIDGVFMLEFSSLPITCARFLERCGVCGHHNGAI